MTPTVIFVHGLPCSGKSTLARKISLEFNLPLYEKDQIKERLFDTVGWSDVAWSRKLSQATKEILFYILAEEIKNGRSLILECNFNPLYDTPRLQGIARITPYSAIQVLCWANGEVLVKRWHERTGKRHPGHNDLVLLDDIYNQLMKGKAEPLDIGGELIEVDTTDFTKIDLIWLFAKITSIMNRQL